MSCFPGQMNEYKNLALDRFDGKNLKCTAYFLSHCHKDHMVGLNYSAFHEHLKLKDGVYLYCTEISRSLLLADEEYCHLDKYICVLDVGVPRHICVPGVGENKEDTFVCVTPISAGHCLGSVMFLFEGGEGTVLYTGDFRWEVDQASRITAFRSHDSVKNLKAVYVDTTFCIPEAFHIPSRNECVEAAFSLISDWLAKGLCNVVSISCPARYGHEHFLLELAKRLNTKVHVPKWKVAVYDQIPDLKGYFTDDASQACLHSCATKSGFTKTSVLPCGYRLPPGERMKLLNIRPSTMWFTSTKTKCNTGDLVVAPATQRGLHRVCYSMHSSYSEIRDLISFIRPGKVFPNVLPASDQDMKTVQRRLENFIQHPNRFRLVASATVDELRPLGALRTRPPKSSTVHQPASFESGSDDLVFSSQELSPCKKSTWRHNGSNTNMSPAKKYQSSKGQGSLNSPRSSPSRDISLESHSSFSGSAEDHDDEEMDLFSDEEEAKCVQGENKIEIKEENIEESVRLYVSGESETEDSDHEQGDEMSESCCRVNVGKMFTADVKMKKESNSLAIPGIGGEIRDDVGQDSEDSNKCFKAMVGGGGCGHGCEFNPNLKDEVLSGQNKNKAEACSGNDDNDDNDCDDDDDDVIPNSQETTVTGDHYFNASVAGLQQGTQCNGMHQKQDLSANSNFSGNLFDGKIIVDGKEVGESHGKKSNSQDDGRNTDSLPLQASQQSVNSINVDSDLDRDCELIPDVSDSGKIDEYTLIKNSSSEVSEDGEIVKNCVEDQLTASNTKLSVPDFSNSTYENKSEENCSEIIDADVEEIQSSEQDDDCVEFLYEDHQRESHAVPAEAGWLSKNSRKKYCTTTRLYGCPSPDETKAEETTSKVSKESHKRKSERGEDRSESSKFLKQEDGFNRSVDREHKSLQQKQLQDRNETAVVDLTLEDSL